jgi:bifunctional enzyme CysN/CysC
MDLIRFTTAGSVDDGKSTLIGRLLYETRSIFDDQLEAVAAASRQFGEERINLALLTDGLRAEREQKITIDVAYRYFATPRRRFVIADTPGHVQYTRNMVTGASTADLAIVLVDATKGVLTQSRRHAFIASLLGIPYMIVAVNKMDLVDFSQAVYDEITSTFTAFASKLTIKNITYLPMSALEGDNVVEPSRRMQWYRGGPLLNLLETAPVGARVNAIDFRFPVQLVIRPHQNFRGYAGTVASGAVKVDDEITVLPSKLTTRVKSIAKFDDPREAAAAGDAVVITTADEIDISRGDMIARVRNVPESVRAIDAYLCWMDTTPLALGKSYVLCHTTRRVRATVTHLEYRLDVDTLHRHEASSLEMNDIGRAQIATSEVIFVDSYLLNSATGSFILIDPQTNATVAAGMIRGASQAPLSRTSKGAVSQAGNISRERREARQQHLAAIVWFTGLPGAGKTTTARLVEERLFAEGHHTMLLDGDQLRHGLCADLAFSPADRNENIRRVGEVARLFFEEGATVLCAFVSPYRSDRDRVRRLVDEGRFIEIFVSADIETCRARDPKGLYRRATLGQVEQFTGLSAPYEPPINPELVIDTTSLAAEAAAERVLEHLRARGLMRTARKDR